MKFEGSAAATVARTLLQAGPSTATDVARTLGLSGAAVRKQLDQLLETGLVESSERAPYGPAALDSNVDEADHLACLCSPQPVAHDLANTKKVWD